MTIHYQPLARGGMRAAYLAQPQGNADEVVRAALRMQSVKAEEPIDIARNEMSGHYRCYIIEGPNGIVYHNSDTPLKETSYTIQVPRKDSTVIVGIRCGSAMDANRLERMIQIVMIYGELVPAGLVPIESTRDQIPASFLSVF